MQTDGKNMGTDYQELLEREINRCKDNEQELYSLDRKRAEDMANIIEKIANITANQTHMQQEMSEFKNDIGQLDLKVEQLQAKFEQVEGKVDNVNREMPELKSEVKEIKKLVEIQSQRKKWEPKDYCVVIVAILSLAGSIITTLIK